jgi:hypothetical protein
MVNEEEMKRKVELYFKHKILVHVNLLSDRYYNGLILEIGSDFFLMQDRIIGEVFILFSEIDWIGKFTDKDGGRE